MITLMKGLIYGIGTGNFILREPDSPYDLRTMRPFRDIVKTTKGPMLWQKSAESPQRQRISHDRA